MDHLRDLALFVAVAEARSFTRAAAKLDMPTSSLSRRIAGLEASLGLRLLNRSTRTVDLTEAGVLYLARCQGIVEAAREAHQQVRGLVETPQGLLRLSVESEIGPLLIAPLIVDFLAQYPRVSIDLDLLPRRVDLLADHFDLAIRVGHLGDSALTVHRLGLLQAGLFASPGYVAQRGTPSHPSMLPGHARIRLLQPADRGEWRLSRGEEVIECDTGSLVSANHVTMVRHLARLGVGIAALDELTVRDDLTSGALVPVLPGWTLPHVAISVLTPTRLLPAKSRLFIGMLTERLSGLTGLAP